MVNPFHHLNLSGLGLGHHYVLVRRNSGISVICMHRLSHRSRRRDVDGFRDMRLWSKCCWLTLASLSVSHTPSSPAVCPCCLRNLGAQARPNVQRPLWPQAPRSLCLFSAPSCH